MSREPMFCPVHPDLWVPCPECPALAAKPGDTPSLDAAWAAAEAALPEGVELYLSKDVVNPPERRYEVEASARILKEGPTAADWEFSGDFPAQIAYGATPAEALQALATRLSESSPKAG